MIQLNKILSSLLMGVSITCLSINNTEASRTMTITTDKAQEEASEATTAPEATTPPVHFPGEGRHFDGASVPDQEEQPAEALAPTNAEEATGETELTATDTNPINDADQTRPTLPTDLLAEINARNTDSGEEAGYLSAIRVALGNGLHAVAIDAPCALGNGALYVGRQALNGLTYVGTHTLDGVTYVGRQTAHGLVYIAIDAPCALVNGARYTGQLVIDGVVYVAVATAHGIMYVTEQVAAAHREAVRGIDLYTPTRDAAVDFWAQESSPTVQQLQAQLRQLTMENAFVGRVYGATMEQFINDLDMILYNLVLTQGAERGGQLFHQFLGRFGFGNTQAALRGLLTPGNYLPFELQMMRHAINGLGLVASQNGAIERALTNRLGGQIEAARTDAENAIRDQGMTERRTRMAIAASNGAFYIAERKAANSVRVSLEAAVEDLRHLLPPEDGVRNRCLNTATAFLATEDDGAAGTVCEGLRRARECANAIHTGGNTASDIADTAVAVTIDSVADLEEIVVVERAGNNFIGDALGRLVAQGAVDATFGRTPLHDNLAAHLLPTDETLDPLPQMARAATERLGVNLEEFLEATGQDAARAATVPMVIALLTQLNDGRQPTEAEVLEFLNHEQTVLRRASQWRPW